MSFLNPVSEPVLMYSSTDANAPQINFAARAAGDVKTVLKACLVTGYGTKQSAGWSIQNETDFVAEFVPPSALLSDYRLGVSDNSSSATTFYYTYQGTRVNPTQNNGQSLPKSPANINKNSANNGWRLIVSAKGVYLITLYQHNYANAVICNVTYWGASKDNLIDNGGKNIMFFCLGANTSGYFAFDVLQTQALHAVIAGFSNVRAMAANLAVINTLLPRNLVTAEIVNSLYLYDATKKQFIAEVPGLLIKTCNDSSKIFGCYSTMFDNRPVLYVCFGANDSSLAATDQSSFGAYIYLDKWDY